MVQHLLLTMVAAPLLVLGAPVTLALLASTPASRRRLSAALRRPPLRTLSQPVVAWALFFGVLWGSHFTGLFEASLRSDGVHALEHVAYLVTAVLFWMPVVGRDPSPVGLSHPARILYLFFAMASMAFLGLALFSANHVLYPTYGAVEGSGEGDRGPADRRDADVARRDVPHRSCARASSCSRGCVRTSETRSASMPNCFANAITARSRRDGAMSVSVGRASRIGDAAATVADYIALTKPRVVSLLVVTGVCGYLAGAAGHVQIGVLLAVAGGGALAAGGANALNCAFDRDLDAVMARTRSRPIPDGRIPILNAVVLGIAMNVAAGIWLTRSANLLAAALALAGNRVVPGGLHGLAQAPFDPEHRDRGRGRLLPAAGGVGRRDGRTGCDRAHARGRDLPVDATALLGARHVAPPGLPARQHPHASGRHLGAADREPRVRLRGGDRRRQPGAGPVERRGRRVHGERRRARRRASSGGPRRSGGMRTRRPPAGSSATRSSTWRRCSRRSSWIG